MEVLLVLGALAAAELAGRFAFAQSDFAHFFIFDGGDQLGIVQLLVLGGGAAHHLPQHDDRGEDEDPQEEGFEGRIQVRSTFPGPVSFLGHRARILESMRELAALGFSAAGAAELEGVTVRLPVEISSAAAAAVAAHLAAAPQLGQKLAARFERRRLRLAGQPVQQRERGAVQHLGQGFETGPRQRRPGLSGGGLELARQHSGDRGGGRFAGGGEPAQRFDEVAARLGGGEPRQQQVADPVARHPRIVVGGIVDRLEAGLERRGAQLGAAQAEQRPQELGGSQRAARGDAAEAFEAAAE